MPKLIFINENAALIECQYVPSAGRTEEQAAANVENTICIPHCAIWKDAALKNEEARNKSNGQKDFKLACLHPSSPYLKSLKEKLEKTGTLE